MTKSELLFIRACKSEDPYTRVRSIYRRFYIPDADDVYIAQILVGIFEKYVPYRLTSILNDLNPEAPYSYTPKDEPYWTRVAKMLISKIRLAHIKNFPGYIAPAHFRRA